MASDEPRLSDYALIGNSCSAALVSKYGSVDWCCLPEFDSPGIFTALLDRQKGGYFSIAPLNEYQSTQKYIADTNVVETFFTTSEGKVKLIDAFATAKEEEKTATLFPDQEMLRMVEGVSGTVKLRVEYVPVIFYGKKCPVLKNNKKLGIQFCWRENIFTLLTTLDPDKIEIGKDQNRTVAEFQINQGEKVFFSLSYSSQSPAVLPELRETAWQRMQGTILFWKEWIQRCHYTGLYREQVKRSALTLKLLAHSPSGSIVAAPTTSLPEEIGGARNWDYRYCWLRDASFTTRALVKLGFEEEAHAYMSWILHATQLTRPKLQVVYSIYGNNSLKEEILRWLPGYKNSRPVRIGNGAGEQFQLDVYGEVLDAVFTYAPLVKEFDNASRKFITGLGEMICKLWNQADNGIWEIRSPGIHHTHSKVMAWVGLDRLIKLCNKYQWTQAPVEKFEDTAFRIRQKVEKFGYNSQLKSYTRELKGNNLDASLLTLSLTEYCSFTSPRMLSTVDLIYKRLSKNKLVYRYRHMDDGIEGREGSFVICSFWLVENFARSGRIAEAVELFEAVLHHASPAGLLSEQIDPESHELLGNYPQGFTHIGLINAALSINEASQKRGTAA